MPAPTSAGTCRPVAPILDLRPGGNAGASSRRLFPYQGTSNLNNESAPAPRIITAFFDYNNDNWPTKEFSATPARSTRSAQRRLRPTGIMPARSGSPRRPKSDEHLRPRLEDPAVEEIVPGFEQAWENISVGVTATGRESAAWSLMPMSETRTATRCSGPDGGNYGNDPVTGTTFIPVARPRGPAPSTPTTAKTDTIGPEIITSAQPLMANAVSTTRITISV
jgi:hypothetical protein